MRITADVVVSFGFETYSLNMGRIAEGKSTSKTAVLLLKDPSKRKLLELSSRSSYIVAKTVESTDGDESRISVEVTVKPDAPPGKLNGTIIAKLSDSSFNATSLRINGTVVGNVEVNPETVRFKVDTSRTIADQVVQKVEVASTKNNVRLRLLSVEDPNGWLAFQVDTLVVNKQYEITMKLRDSVMTLKRNTSGDVRIRTDDAEQPEMRVRYHIIIPR